MEQESLRRKIEETVIEFLRNADLETATECTIRTAVAEKLGVDLSDLDSKWLVRRTLESFLLASASPNTVEKVSDETKEIVEVPQPETTVAREARGRVICKLSRKRRVYVQNSRGKPMVSIKEFCQKDGKQCFDKGITLTEEQWSAFRSSVPEIEAAIVKMESRMRAEGLGTRSEAGVSTSFAASASKQHVPVERSQIEEGVSNSVAPFPPQALTPIATTRFNGKNYYCWMHQMEFFLRQLKIAYVLTEPCPLTTIPKECYKDIGPAKMCMQKWINDDYLCRHNILNSLSDQLFDQYSAKICSARELWEQLRSTYADDFGTMRSLVNNYIQFQMVDGISVLEQVQELHKIADSIIASGVWFDVNFHVSTIISKLPPSWKERRAKLMCEEFLPLDKLMYQLQEEEELRNRQRNHEHYKNVPPVIPNSMDKLGPNWRETKRVCYNCGMEGHMARNCPQKKFDHREQSNRKENEVVPVSSDVDMAELVTEHPEKIPGNAL